MKNDSIKIKNDSIRNPMQVPKEEEPMRKSKLKNENENDITNPEKNKNFSLDLSKLSQMDNEILPIKNKDLDNDNLNFSGELSPIYNED